LSSFLVVENHPATRDHLASQLRAEGHRVQVAADTQAAWDLFAAEPFDAILLSLALPPGEALGLVTRVRVSPGSAPVVAYDHAHLGQALGKPVAMRLRPDAYVADLTRRELLNCLHELLERARADLPASSARVTAVLSRPPSTQGPLREGTLPGVLVMLWRTFRDGVLVLQHGDVERRVYLRHGRPVNADSTVRAEAFDRWLFELGRLSEAHYREALHERVGDTLSAGASLVAVGALEPGPPLLSLLREHLQWQLSQAVGLRQGLFRFHAGDEFLPDVQLLEVPALAHLLTGARSSFSLRIFLQALQPERARYPCRAPEFGDLLPELGLVTRDLKRALDLTGRLSTRELLAAPQSGIRELAPLLWFLRLAEAVRFEERPVESDQLPVATPRLKALSESELAAIRDAALTILPATFYRALELDIACSADEIEAAYHRLAERYHPDRFAGHDLSEVADLLTQIQDKLGAAYRVLGDPEKRLAYLELLLKRSEGTPRGGRPLEAEAEVAAKHAERALRSLEFRQAIEMLRRATQLAPREPDFWSHLALAQLLDMGTALESRVTAARQSAARALSLDRSSARVLSACALVEVVAGEPAAARPYALAALRVSPQYPMARAALARANRVS
jgi:CheY-like chemotaxis protein